MPQLDIYRAFDEIILILLVLIQVYFLIILVVIPLLIKRICIKKSQDEIQNIETWTNQVDILKNNLEKKEENTITKL
jgi:hypothetical protein